MIRSRMPQYRAGYNDQGLQLSDIDDIPMWSAKDLSAATTQNFFDVGGGPNESTSLLTQNQIDTNKDYDVKIIEMYIMNTSKTAFVAADLDKIAGLQNDFFLEIFTNEARRSWSAPVGGILRYPMAVAAAGASAYNPMAVVAGAISINMPVGEGLVLKGGQAFSCQLSTKAAAPSNPTGLRMLIVLRGRRYALIVAK